MFKDLLYRFLSFWKFGGNCLFFEKNLNYRLISLNCGPSYEIFNHVLESCVLMKNM